MSAGRPTDGLEVARRMALERCDMRLDTNGVARPIREPLPVEHARQQKLRPGERQTMN